MRGIGAGIGLLICGSLLACLLARPTGVTAFDLLPSKRLSGSSREAAYGAAA